MEIIWGPLTKLKSQKKVERWWGLLQDTTSNWRMRCFASPSRWLPCRCSRMWRWLPSETRPTKSQRPSIWIESVPPKHLRFKKKSNQWWWQRWEKHWMEFGQSFSVWNDVLLKKMQIGLSCKLMIAMKRNIHHKVVLMQTSKKSMNKTTQHASILAQKTVVIIFLIQPRHY